MEGPHGELLPQGEEGPRRAPAAGGPIPRPAPLPSDDTQALSVWLNDYGSIGRSWFPKEQCSLPTLPSAALPASPLRVCPPLEGLGGGVAARPLPVATPPGRSPYPALKAARGGHAHRGGWPGVRGDGGGFFGCLWDSFFTSFLGVYLTPHKSHTCL